MSKSGFFVALGYAEFILMKYMGQERFKGRNYAINMNDF
jgi:hypothetical protein